MKYELLFTRSYTRRAARFIRKHPELRSQYRKTLAQVTKAEYLPTYALQGWFSGMILTEVIKRTLDAGLELSGENLKTSSSRAGWCSKAPVAALKANRDVRDAYLGPAKGSSAPSS